MIIRINETEARQISMRILEVRMGAPRHIAEATTSALIYASLRGIESHGIGLLPGYLAHWEKGRIVPNAEPRKLTETTTTVLLDANQTLGHYASLKAADNAIEKARNAGVGTAVIRNSNHNGAIGFYANRIAEKKMLGIVASACAPHVAPHGGTKGIHGTNPISYAIPRKSESSIVFDFATGYSAAKTRKIANTTGHLPKGFMVNEKGRPTTDPKDIETGWILPAAGSIGYGLGILVDALTAGLADSPIGQEVPLVSNVKDPYCGTFSAIALSPDAFGGWGGFSSRIETLVDQIRRIPPQDPNYPVRLPGERGWEERKLRIDKGIPIEEEELKNLRELARFDP